jgi:hypothetical protein
MIKAALISSSIISALSEAPPVPVELYFEALCPGCQDFTTGPLKRVLEKPDMVEIMTLKLVPYGNTKKNADGTFTCQHGADECASDALELCTEYKLSGSLSSISSGDTSLSAWPFILCMEEAEGDPSYGQSCYESTMNTTAVSWSTITACTVDEFAVVQSAAADATPKHDCKSTSLSL